jgi:hypothetical protein
LEARLSTPGLFLFSRGHKGCFEARLLQGRCSERLIFAPMIGKTR